MTVQFILNGKKTTVHTAPTKRLVDILREDLGVSSPRSGCRKGVCGACSIIMNGAIVRACLIPAFAVREREIMTIEGLEGSEAYSTIIRAFETEEYFPCDFCFPQKVLATYALLEHNQSPDVRAIVDALHVDGCLRCDGSAMVRAVQGAAVQSRGSKNGRY